MTRATVPAEQAVANTRASLARGFPRFAPDGSQKRGPMIIVGGGPSVALHTPTIRRLAEAGIPVMALKGAWRHLEQSRIPVAACLLMDPHPCQTGYLPDWPLPIKWIVASQCDPAVFDKLQGHDVAVWYGPELPHMRRGAGLGSRAIRVAQADGYGPLPLFGMDGSFKLGAPTHIYDLKNDGSEPFDVLWGGRFFVSTEPLVQEVETIVDMYVKRDGPEIKVYGGGLLGHALTWARRSYPDLPDPVGHDPGDLAQDVA